MIATTKHARLQPVADFPFLVLASADLGSRTRSIGMRCEWAYRFLGEVLGFR